MGFLKSRKLLKTVLMVSVASFLAVFSQGVLAKDFAEVTYEDREVIWGLSLPDGATGVIVRVLFTPNDLKADSYLEEYVFEPGMIAYPFNGELEDGTYTWELRLLHEYAKIIGFIPSSNKEEGPIDENGRQIELVGEPPPVPEGKIRVSNSGRDSIQQGSFRVVKGTIPRVWQEEE